jgi:hypothetical protein
MPMVMLKFLVIAGVDPDKRKGVSMTADDDEPKAISEGESMATDDGESVMTGDGESMATSDGESMVTSERAGDPIDPNPVVPTDGAN